MLLAEQSTTYLQAIVLGVVQGIAEFLPISSSGHLVILGALFFPEQGSAQDRLDLNIALHVGTLLSILLVYRREILQLLKSPRYVSAVILATVPVGIVGLTLKDLLQSAFETPLVAGIGLLITACLLLLSHANQKPPSSDETEPTPSLAKAILIGSFQALAIVPGISRSGSTIAGGLLLGLDRQSAARFSFLIAIPAICGAAVVEGKDLLLGSSEVTPAWAPMGVGALVSFLVGWVSLEWLLRLISKGRLPWFAAYCGTAGLLTILWQSM